MKKEDIVKVTAYLTNAEDVGIYLGICDQMLGGHITALNTGLLCRLSLTRTGQ